MLSSQCSHELCMNFRRRFQHWQRTDLFADQAVASKRISASRALLQVSIQLSGNYIVSIQFSVCSQQHLCLGAIHSSLTSCLYKFIKRSRARIKRIFTADALICNISAISAQERPSFSYSQRHTAYLGGICFRTRSTISRSATRLSKRPPS